jgi:hypothetical protein
MSGKDDRPSPGSFSPPPAPCSAPNVVRVYFEMKRGIFVRASADDASVLCASYPFVSCSDTNFANVSCVRVDSWRSR